MTYSLYLLFVYEENKMPASNARNTAPFHRICHSGLSLLLALLFNTVPVIIGAQTNRLDTSILLTQTTAHIHLAFDSASPKFVFATKIPLTYYAGDCTTKDRAGKNWTDVDYDDRQWGKLRVGADMLFADSVWHGIGCFRLRITVDSSLRNSIVILRVRHQSSASEIYWDGVLRHRFGNVHALADSEEVYGILGDAVPIYFDSASEHLIAIRFSAHNRHEDLAKGFRLRFQSGSWAQYVIDYNQTSLLQDGSVLVTCAVAAVLCLLHVLMFFAYRKNYLHWWIAALWGVLFLSQVLEVLTRYNTASHVLSASYETAGLILLVASYEFSLFVLYRICYGKIPFFTIWVGGLFIIHFVHRLLPIGWRLVSWEASLLPIALVTTFEVLRIVWKTGKRIPYIRILAFGFIGSFVGYIVSGFFYDYLYLLFNSYTPGRLLVQFSILSYPTSFTVYAAREFTRRERLLARQNEELEAEVKSRTDELSKANAHVQLVNTELQEVNEELLSTNQALDDANHFKTQMLSIVAHDLKNPLNVIMNCADMLSESAVKGSLEEAMATNVYASADRMMRLIHDLLDTAAIEIGKMEITSEPFNWGLQVAAIGKFYQEVATEKQQIIDMSKVKPCVINGDEERLWQVVDNLCSNAVKYSALGGVILICCNADEQFARLSVQDSGPGFTEDDKTKLFGHFQRLSAQPTANETSSGVGLSIVKKIVDLHNGRIWVESEYGKGATFFVELPVR